MADAPDPRTDDERACGAVVLAAGEARRFGAQKLLMPFGATTIIGSVVGALAAAGIAPIVVVTGAGTAAVSAALQAGRLRSQIVRNPDPARGMVSSVRVGVAALPEALDRFLVALGDQPRIRPEAIAHLMRAHRESGKGIVIPTYRAAQGAALERGASGAPRKRGHPIILSGRYRDEVLALTDQQTLRDLIHLHADDCADVECGDDAFVRDIDTQDEYRDELRRFREEQ